MEVVGFRFNLRPLVLQGSLIFQEGVRTCAFAGCIVHSGMKWGYLIGLIFLFACKKSSSDADDREAPVIILQTPGAGASYSTGSTITISGSISDANRIVQVHFHISNEESGQLLVDIHRYPGESVFAMNETFTIPAAGNYRIRIIARDNEGNEGLETVSIIGQ